MAQSPAKRDAITSRIVAALTVQEKRSMFDKGLWILKQRAVARFGIANTLTVLRFSSADVFG